MVLMYLWLIEMELLIYHPDKTRIGESVESNLVVQKLMEEKSGALHKLIIHLERTFWPVIHT